MSGQYRLYGKKWPSTHSPKKEIRSPSSRPLATRNLKKLVPQKNKFVGSTESSQGRGAKVRNCRN